MRKPNTQTGATPTGAEAYKTYSGPSAAVFQRLGGRIVWRGTQELMMVGPQAEARDIVFVAQYPSVNAFSEMMKIKPIEKR